MFGLTHGILESMGGGSKGVSGTSYASGGVITYIDNDAIHTFNASSNLIVHNSIDISILLVGGGGGSGLARAVGSKSPESAGAGGGFVLISSLSLSPDTYPVVIGNGGLKGAYATPYVDSSWNGKKGGTSTFYTLSASGGYGSIWRGTDDNPSDGATSARGYIGGAPNYYNNGAAGGGGGDSSVGKGAGSDMGGLGGEGTHSSISGIDIGYGGGGGGAASHSHTMASGKDGGGSGGTLYTDVQGLDASANTGGGAGGVTCLDSTTDGNNGADGVVIIRYKYK